MRPLLERLLPATGRRTNARRRVRLVAVAVIVALAYSALLAVAGTPESTFGAAPPVPPKAANCADTAAAAVRQPRPAVATVPLPTITVRDAVNVSTQISAATARRIVRDAIDDLAIAANAVVHRNPLLASDAARFPWVDELITTICATRGPLVISNYRIMNATVIIAKRFIGQVAPEIDLELRGELRRTTFTRATPHRLLAEHTVPYRDTLVVANTDGYWLVCGSRADRRTSTCVT